MELALNDYVDLGSIMPKLVDLDPVIPDTIDITLVAAIADYQASGKAVVYSSATSDEVKSPGWSAVLVGGDGFDRLREAAGDDVMYGGAGPDQFVWDLRGTARSRSEHDTILDLDFAEGDVLRIMQDSGQAWISSLATLTAAIENGTLAGGITHNGELELWLPTASSRVMELALNDYVDIV
jgi:hypothetical protein